MLLKDKAHRLVDDVQASAISPNVGQADLSAEPQPGQLSMPALYADAAQSALPATTPNTDALPAPAKETHTQPLRAPVFVPGSGKKSTGLKPPQGRRLVVSTGVAVLLVAILLGTLFAVLPTGNGQANGSLASLFTSKLSVTQSKNNTTALIAAQAATATAVTQDGYDAGNQVYAGVQSGPTYTTTTTTTSSIAPSDSGSLNRFFYGQCTYWANMRYHELTGHWVPWLGNAADWAWQAPNNGWVTSSVPNPNGPSIVVLAPYTQGAGAYGHVAVVEGPVSQAAAANGVSTTNWNWSAGGGGWAITSPWTFYPGGGVTFIWY
jgi:Surface antigen